ncbi:MAG TPA: enoyl-CoA hydratase/isomerase family protein [Solirubrobacterales bacterium]|nr:enoyl-CoA hydratase/isomerase family protein [Solirubrobacterales bacterium]
MANRTVQIERSGRVLVARLDNPPRNFMTTAMVGELEALVHDLEHDRSVGAVVLTGAPPDVFITHFDVEEIRRGTQRVGATVSSTQAGGGLRAVGAAQRIPGARGLLERSPVGGMSALLQIHDLFLRMNRLDKVFVAAINGLALGGGCELALACDIRIMARGDHRIGLPEVTLGIIPGAGGTQRLVRALGQTRALEMMLEGRVLTPDEAVEAGLVHRTAEPDRLLDEAMETAARLARRSPVAVKALKEAVYEGASKPLPQGLHVERAGFMAAASTPAARRALGAYAEEVARSADGAPWQDGDLMARWQDGTAVDMVSG